MKKTRFWTIWGIKSEKWLNKSQIRNSNAWKAVASWRGIRRRQSWIQLLLRRGKKVIYWETRLIELSTATKTMEETSSNWLTLPQTKTNNIHKTTPTSIMNWRMKYWNRRQPRCPSRANNREATSHRLWWRLQTSSRHRARSSARPSIEAKATRIRRGPIEIKLWCTKAGFW